MEFRINTEHENVFLLIFIIESILIQEVDLSLIFNFALKYMIMKVQKNYLGTEYEMLPKGIWFIWMVLGEEAMTLER